MAARQSKRQRTARNGPAFGAPSAADDPAAQFNVPSSAASSTRLLPVHEVPSLTTLCGRKFATTFVNLHKREDTWKRVVGYLDLVPDPLISKLFRMLCSACPTFLSHEIIVTHFLRGPAISWSRDVLPGVSKHTLRAIPRLNNSLQELRLTGFDKFTDDMFAWVVSQLPQLRILVLRECKNVGLKTVGTVASTCPELRVANFNYTSVPPSSLAPLLVSCPRLEVLKVAKVSNWTDSTFTKFLSALDSDFRHVCLKTLKLRHTALSDNSMTALINICPNLQRLDVSFTSVRRPSTWLVPEIGSQIEKLSLTSTATSGSDLLGVIKNLPHLKILSLGALGVGTSPNTSVSNSTAMTLTDSVLRSLVTTLAGLSSLESLSLVGNAKLGATRKGEGPLHDLVSVVGRNCKYLNLSAITSLRSADFVGLLPDVENDHRPPLLETLVINNTGVDDEISPFLACCHELLTLEVGGTKLTEEGLMPIIDGCPRLINLDLTSCRGVNVVDRRRFFEVWAASRNPKIGHSESRIMSKLCTYFPFRLVQH
ncbi:RNI-like protein [Hymenopellis radicata]|nr:RNI-like protein [Hymenopellis radicata]